MPDRELTARNTASQRWYHAARDRRTHVRCYAGPVNTLFRSRGQLWQPPVSGILPVTDLGTLRPGAWEGTFEFQLGTERWMGVLAGDATAGHGTTHLLGLQQPGSRTDPSDGPWLTLKARRLEGGFPTVTAGEVQAAAEGDEVVYTGLINRGANGTIGVRHKAQTCGAKTEWILSAEGVVGQIILSVRAPAGSVYDSDAHTLYVRDGEGRILFRLPRALPATDALGSTCLKAWRADWAAVEDGLQLLRLDPTNECDAWIAAGRAFPIAIDPTVTAGAQSGRIESFSETSWAAALAGDDFTVLANNALMTMASYDDGTPDWTAIRPYLQHATDGIGILASAALFARIASIDIDGGTVRVLRLSSDYSTLTTADWGAAEAASEGDITLSEYVADDWVEVPLDADGINTSGNTCYILREKAHDVDNADPNDNGGATTIYGATFYGPDTAGSEPYLDLALDTNLGRFRTLFSAGAFGPIGREYAKTLE